MNNIEKMKHLRTNKIRGSTYPNKLTNYRYTMKLGYNELGYNEHSVITNTWL
jgi:hypothetical protein